MSARTVKSVKVSKDISSSDEDISMIKPSRKSPARPPKRDSSSDEEVEKKKITKSQSKPKKRDSSSDEEEVTIKPSKKSPSRPKKKDSSSDEEELKKKTVKKVPPKPKKKDVSSSEENIPMMKPGKKDSSSEEETKNVLSSKSKAKKSTFLNTDKELARKQAKVNNTSSKDKKFAQTKTAKKMSELTPYVVTGLKVDILRREELKNISVGSSVIEPKEDKDGGIDDPIAGALNENNSCVSCGEDNLGCIGHMRYIQLPEELKFIPNVFLANVAMILRSVCKYCSGLLVTKAYMSQTELLDYNGSDRLKKLSEECVTSNLRCQRYRSNMPGVFSPLKKDPTNKITKDCLQNPIYKVNPNFIQCVDQNSKSKSKSLHRTMNEQGEQAVPLTMFEIAKIFTNISEEDKVLMGFPYDYDFMDLIVDKLPVIPPNARPQVYRDGEAKSAHFTFATSKLIEEIVNYNSKPNKDEISRLDTMNMIYLYYNHMVDNTDESLKRGHNDVVDGVKHKFTGKQGLFRNTMMGKKVNFTCRTVIGPDSNLKFGEIGMPDINKSELTVPETVTVYNIDRLQKMYDEGKIKKITIGPNPRGKRIEGRSLRANIVRTYITKLAVGDKVDRYSEDGDLNMVGRQPTLHKEGLLGFETVYHKEMNTRVHMVDTTGYNADFDGDEMTAHVPQTVGALGETLLLASTKNNIMDSKKSKTRVGLTYNHPTSLFIMTQAGEEEQFFSEEEIEEATSILTHTDDFGTIQQRLKEKGINPLCGRALFSYLLPAGFCYRGKKSSVIVKTKLSDGAIVNTEIDTTVIIDDGILVNGCITKSHVGATQGSIVHHLWLDKGTYRTSAFLTDGTFLADWFIRIIGFSIGQFDCMAPNPGEIKKIVDEEMRKTQISIAALGPELPSMTKAEKRYRESQIRNYTNNASTIGKKIVQEQLPITNALNIMSDSGAKGNAINTGSIMAALGQQFFRSERPKTEIDGGRRFLPYFPPNSIQLEARGMVLEYYMEGLRPASVISHAMAARFAAIASATLTGFTGFIQYRISKALESVVVAYDGSIRNSTGACFQLVCADGMETGKMMQNNISGVGDVYSFINISSTVRDLNLNMAKKIKELGLKEKAEEKKTKPTPTQRKTRVLSSSS
jgi:DNA-directed RNA polymerase beta' subunit